MKRLCRQLKFLTFGDIKREGCTFVIEDVGVSLETSVFTSQLFGSFLRCIWRRYDRLYIVLTEKFPILRVDNLKTHDEEQAFSQVSLNRFLTAFLGS